MPSKCDRCKVSKRVLHANDKFIIRIPDSIKQVVAQRYGKAKYKFCMECVRAEFGCSYHSEDQPCVLRDRPGATGVFRKDSPVQPHRYNFNQFSCVPVEQPVEVAQVEKKQLCATFSQEIENYVEDRRQMLSLTPEEAKKCMNNNYIKLRKRLQKRKERKKEKLLETLP